jgi:hypothetical protein
VPRGFEIRKSAFVALLALVGVTGSAFAAGRTPLSARSSPPVLFVLQGTLGTYTPALGFTSGSIAITVKDSTYESARLKNHTLSFPVSSTTKIVGAVKSGHAGIVKVRAAKNASVKTLQTVPAEQVVAQGKSG